MEKEQKYDATTIQVLGGIDFSVSLTEGQKGFVVLLQDQKKGTILALGEYSK